MNKSKKLQNSKKYKCDQMKCAFMTMGIGCQACDSCKTEPYILDENCDRCWNCSKDLGILRWDNNGEIKEEQKQVMTIKAK